MDYGLARKALLICFSMVLVIRSIFQIVSFTTHPGMLTDATHWYLNAEAFAIVGIQFLAAYLVFYRPSVALKLMILCLVISLCVSGGRLILGYTSFENIWAGLNMKVQLVVVALLLTLRRRTNELLLFIIAVAMCWFLYSNLSLLVRSSKVYVPGLWVYYLPTLIDSAMLLLSFPILFFLSQRSNSLPESRSEM